MRKFSEMRDYQVLAAQFLVEKPSAMLWLDMGLGKTAITLTALDWLFRTEGLKGALVVAPLRVCRTVWRQEARDWEHLWHLKFSLLVGDARARRQALLDHSDIYLVNYDNLPWLVQEMKTLGREGWRPPFDVAVWDEVTCLKNSTSKRSKAAGLIAHTVKRRVGLTGTPAPKGVIDLHGQFLAADKGVRLGTTKTSYLNRFFSRNYSGWGYTPVSGAWEAVKDLVSDITLDMSNAGRVRLPPFTVNDIILELDAADARRYRLLEKEFFVRLDSGTEIEAFNAGALTNKCLQFANGAVYDGEGEWSVAHGVKLEALLDIISSAGGSPVLVAYSFRSDAARILAAIPDAVDMSALKGSELEAAVTRWNAGGIPVLIGHPASMGHGLNLQHGGHILVWFGLNWASDLYDQFNARLYRSGQTKPVVCHRLLVKGTLDEAVREALSVKADAQTSMREAVRRYREGSGSHTAS